MRKNNENKIYPFVDFFPVVSKTREETTEKTKVKARVKARVKTIVQTKMKNEPKQSILNFKEAKSDQLRQVS